MKLFFFLIFLAPYAFGQGPISQIYLFDVQSLATGQLGVHHPRLLTGFNLHGYNNQPSFINDQELLLTSQMPSTNNTDIYLLNLNNNTRQQITNTSRSEYSPMLTPDKTHISCVRVDEPASTGQPNAVQRLYTFELKAHGMITNPLPDIKNVGYHAWLNNNDVALFLVNKPSQLALVDIRSKDPLVFTSDVGRCLVNDGKGHLIYVHKITETDWYIKDYDPLLQRASIVVETIPGSEDFVLLPDGKIMMGKGSKLFVYTSSTQKTWSEVADLKYYGIQNITRLAFKGNHLALVNQPK